MENIKNNKQELTKLKTKFWIAYSLISLMFTAISIYVINEVEPITSIVNLSSLALCAAITSSCVAWIFTKGLYADLKNLKVSSNSN